MSTSAPALVITTVAAAGMRPAAAGGELSVLPDRDRSGAEARGVRAAVPAPARRPRALYPKLRPGPHACAREAVFANQRARLCGAMIELVAARGYEASTVAELCALAGVSKRTLYERYPGGKQECFLATYDTVVRHVYERMLAACRRGPQAPAQGRAPVGPPAGLRVAVEALAHEVAAYPNAARLVVVEAGCAGPVLRARAERTRRLIERAILTSLHREVGTSVAASALVSFAARRIATDGERLVRARLLDGRVSVLADELPKLCFLATAPLSRRPGGQSARPPAGAPTEKPSLVLDQGGD